MEMEWQSKQPVVMKRWRAAWLALIPKPAKTGSNPSHWRPIGLQDALGKASLKCVVASARDSVLPHLTSWPQYAYLKGRGTLEALNKGLTSLQ